MAMRKSKCVCCETGIVFDRDCTKVIGHVWCSIDAYTEGFTRCTPDGCSYYGKRNEKEERKP